MKYLIPSLYFLFLGCTNNDKIRYEFKPILCKPSETPKYDENRIPILDEYGDIIYDEVEGGVVIRDSLGKGIIKKRSVFKPCREMIFDAEFKSENKKLITKSKIKLMANGKRWKFQPEKQDEITVQFEFTQEDYEINLEYQLNKGLLTNNWNGEVKEGVIENVEEVWMHPFRHNQFNFTEIAPFPQIKYPLEIGKTWTENLGIQGWGDWDNSSINSYYEVVDSGMVITKYGIIDNCWKVHSKSIFKLGESVFEYWFNEELGFVKMNYLNYGNQTLSIELIEIIDSNNENAVGNTR
jgi:hypothetical protein